MNTTYKIHVDAGDNCKVTPSVVHLNKRADTAEFTSDNPKTCIRYGNTSPFAEAEIGPNTILAIGLGNGKRYLGVNSGNHHFDCGFLNEAAVFVSYLYPSGQIASAPSVVGGDTDVDP